jgi:hypothetical protein
LELHRILKDDLFYQIWEDIIWFYKESKQQCLVHIEAQFTKITERTGKLVPPSQRAQMQQFSLGIAPQHSWKHFH